MEDSLFALETGDQPFTADPAKSFTIPARYHFDPSIYEREKEAIFYRCWWCAGHVSQVPEPGCCLETHNHDQSVIVVRGRDGE